MLEMCSFYPGTLGGMICGPECPLFINYGGGCYVKKYAFDLIDQVKTLIAEVMLEEILDLEKVPLWKLRNLESLWEILQHMMGRLGNCFNIINKAFPIYDWLQMEIDQIKKTEPTGQFRISFIFPLDEWDRFKKFAQGEKRTAAAVMRQLIRDWLESKEHLFNNIPE